MIGIESAGIGQDPQLGTLQPLRLPAHRRARALERLAVRSNPHHSDGAGMKPTHFAQEPSAAGAEFVRRELVGGRGRASNQVGDSDPVLKEKLLLPGSEQSGGEAAGVESGPEAIARAVDVAPCGRGIETGPAVRKENAGYRC